jgi:integrase
MSRRSQVGSIETSGKWYVLRLWKDVPGNDKRIHASERICPINGPGSLTKAERKRKATEIVARSGVNCPERLAQLSSGITFREQAASFLQKAVTRKRNPIKPATAGSWQNCINKWLNPNLGETLLANINNMSLKLLVAKMHEAGLSAKSIVTYTGLVKQIVASAVDDDGEQRFPRKWNHEFIDMPIVENQHQPIFTPETVSSIVATAEGQQRALFALLAGTGMRVGEALGLEIKHFSQDFRIVTIEQSCWGKTLQHPKTRNAIREIDLCSELATLMQKLIGHNASGFVFRNRAGKLLSQTNLLRRSLHPILLSLGVKKAGFHAMRRFRTTWLRKQCAPEELIRFWLGHAERNVTDGYSKLKEDRAFRRETAERIGLGFNLEAPSVRNVRRNEDSHDSEFAA